MGTEIGHGVPLRDNASRKRELVTVALGRILGSAAALLFVMALLAMQFRRVLG